LVATASVGFLAMNRLRSSFVSEDAEIASGGSSCCGRSLGEVI